MNRLLYFFFCGTFMLLLSCTKTQTPDAAPAGSLHPFNVSLVERTSVSAVIQWNSCINTINNEVPRYRVILKDSIIHNNLNQLIDSLKALNKDTVYRGKVVAYISTGDTLFSSFTLPTYQGTIYAATYTSYNATGQLGSYGAYPTLQVYPQPMAWRINTPLVNGPTLSNDTLFAQMGYQIVAVNAKTGNRLWATSSVIYFNSPATYYNGRLYACSDSGLTAINSTNGQVIWKYASPLPGFPFNTSPVIDGGKVFVASTNKALNGVHAVDAITGAKIWSAIPAGSISQRPLAKDGTLVLLSGHSSTITVYNNSTGSILWAVTGPGASSSLDKFNPVFSNGNVLANLSGTLTAFDLKTGAKVWAFTESGDLRDCVTGNGMVFFCNDRIGSNGSNIYCVNASTGRVVWKIPFSDNFGYSHLLFAKDKLYGLYTIIYGVGGNELTALSPLTGKTDPLFSSGLNPITKSLQTDINSFTIVRDNVVYYPSYHGNFISQ